MKRSRPATPAVLSAPLAAVAALAFALMLSAPVPAQEGGFGFGEAEGDSGAAAASALELRGAIGAGASVYLDDPLDLGSASLGDMAFARLDLSARGSIASGRLSLRLAPAALSADPASLLDQAYLSLSLGSLSLDAGLMKLSWGRADSGGPLDVLNPNDLSDLSVDPLERKVAVPLARLSVLLGQASEIQAAFIPGRRGNAYALGGRWEPAAFKAAVAASLPLATLEAGLSEAWELGKSQAGIRFTTSASGLDFGAQYFYGWLRDPTLYLPSSGSPSVSYARYHQLGLDAALILAGISLRGEAALNLGVDLSGADISGTDPALPNPALAFDLAAERALPADFVLALRWSGSYRLASGSISDPDDIEFGAPALESSLGASLSRTFLKGALTASLAGEWGISDADYLIRPSLSLNFGDGIMGLSAGIFGGSASGSLGQYASASYVRAGISFTF